MTVVLTCLYLISEKDIFFYGTLLIILISTLKRNSNKIKVLFLPIPSLIIYFTINIIVGYFAFSNGLIYKSFENVKYYGTDYSNEYNIFILLLLFTFHLIDIYFHRKEKLIFSVSDQFHDKVNYSRINYIYITLMIMFFIFISTVLSTYFNTQGGIFSVPVTYFSILLLYRLSNKINIFRYVLIFISLLVIFTIFNYDSKREVIVILIAGVIFLLKNKKIPFFRIFILGIIGLLLAVHLIITLSILRGWLGFEANSIQDAIRSSFDYIYNPSNLLYVLHNFESPAIYNNGLHAYFYLKFNIITPNFAIIDSIFWFVPNFIAELRPQSIIDRFTSVHNSSLRDDGYSLVSGVITEFIWSFGLIMGIISIIPFYFLMQKFTLKIKYSPLLIYGFLLLHLSMFLRGSGLVLFIQYFFIYYLAYSISKLMKL